MSKQRSEVNSSVEKIPVEQFFSKSTQTKALVIIGSALGIFSVLFMLITGAGVLSGFGGSIVTGLFVFFLLLTTVALYLILSGFKTLNKINKEHFEKRILAAIAQHHGRVTSMEVAIATELNFDDVKSTIERLCVAGAGEAQITPNGEIVYLFNGFVLEEEKRQAKNPLEIS